MSTISGSAWHDLDGDGVMSKLEPGLEGVVIQLWKAGVRVSERYTDSDGRYAFTNLSSGIYTVSEEQPAWLRFSSTPNERPVILLAIQNATVSFGDWNGLKLWVPLLLLMR